MAETGKQQMDPWFEKIQDYITKGISRFVAFLFTLIAVGAVFGYLVASKAFPGHEWLLIAPAAVGLVAYYNRTFATAVFILLVIIVIL